MQYYVRQQHASVFFLSMLIFFNLSGWWKFSYIWSFPNKVLEYGKNLTKLTKILHSESLKKIMKVRFRLQRHWSVARQTGWLKLVDGHSMNKHKERTVWILALYRWNLHLQFKNNWPPEQKKSLTEHSEKIFDETFWKKSLTKHSEKNLRRNILKKIFDGTFWKAHLSTKLFTKQTYKLLLSWEQK